MIYLLRGAFEPFEVEFCFADFERKGKKHTQAAALVSSWTREYSLSTEPIGANGSECL